jgi:uncharacterized protein (TIGR02246 family)
MKTHAVFFFAVMFAFIALSACTRAGIAPASPTPTPDFASEARSMMDRYTQAVLNMDSQTIASLFLPDGAVYDNGKLKARGPDAILKFLKSFDGVVRVDKYQTTITSVQVSGNTVILTGTFQQQYTLLANNQTGTSSGNFTAEWVHQADSKWSIRKMATQE